MDLEQAIIESSGGDIVDVKEFERDLDENVPDVYAEFRDNEGIPVHTGLSIKDINTVSTGAWDRTGQNGAFVNLYGAEGVDDLQINELEPNGQTKVRNTLYEELVYVTEGRGFTAFGREEDIVFEWDTNAVFLIPPNTPFRHINASDSESARLVSQTPLPLLLNVLKNDELLFLDTETQLAELGVDEEDYSGDGIQIVRDDGLVIWDANFIPDIMRFDKIRSLDHHGALRTCRLLPNAGQTAHVAELPALTYKTAHRHGPGASVFYLTGEGYSLLWRENWETKVKVEWGPRSVLPPPARWFHQHFNTTEDPVRMFAMHWPRLGALNENRVFDHYYPENVIPYVNEDPLIREKFEQELDKNGLESSMPPECYADPDFSFGHTR